MPNGDGNPLYVIIVLAAVALAALFSAGLLPASVAGIVRIFLIALFVVTVLSIAGIVVYLVWAGKQHEKAEANKYSGMNVKGIAGAEGREQMGELSAEWRERQRRRPVGKPGGPTMRSSSQEEIAGTRYGMNERKGPHIPGERPEAGSAPAVPDNDAGEVPESCGDESRGQPE